MEELFISRRYFFTYTGRLFARLFRERSKTVYCIDTVLSKNRIIVVQSLIRSASSSQHLKIFSQDIRAFICQLRSIFP